MDGIKNKGKKMDGGGKVIKFKGIDLSFLEPRKEVLSPVGANVVT
jgi:hypothetical protein